MSNLPIPESYWVEEDRLLAGEYPGSYNLETARRRIRLFLEGGLTTFIDLTQPHEHVSYEGILKEEAGLHEIDVSYHRLAIPDHSIPSVERMNSTLDVMDEAIKNGGKVYVHCWGGIGRTGVTVGCYLVRHGMDGEQAVEQVNRLYKTRPRNEQYPRSPETDTQIQFVRDWREAAVKVHEKN